MPKRNRHIHNFLFVLMISFPACCLAAGRKGESARVPSRLATVDSSREYGLAALVDLALQNNPATSIAWQTARIKAASLDQARSDYYPKLSTTLDVGGTWSEERDVTVAGLALTETTPLAPAITPALSLTWVMFDLQRDFATKSAKLSLISARHSFDRTMQDIIFDVQQAYLQLDEDIALHEAGKAAVALAATTVEAITAQFNAGLTDKGALLQARQNLEQARYNLQSEEEQLSTSRSSLLITTGLPANAPIKIKMLGDGAPLSRIAASVDRLIDDAMRSRPDIAAKYADVLALEAGVQEAEVAWAPTVSLGGKITRSHRDDRVLVPNAASGKSASTASRDTLNEAFMGLTVSFDIFDGFSKKAALKEAQAELELAREELVQAELQAGGEVWNNYFQYKSAEKKVEYAKRLYAASKSANEAVGIGYQQGLKTVLDVLDSQNKLASSEATLIGARTELLTKSVQLAYATGSTSAAQPRLIGDQNP
jgi:outer membrane protein TolC